MAAHKFLKIGANGLPTEEPAITTSAGAGDEGKLIAAGADGKIDSTLLPTTPDDTTRTASEAISAANILNVWDDAGTPKIRKADATNATKLAMGFAPSAIASGAAGKIQFEGTIIGLVGLTRGATYFLHTTPGAITDTAPSGSGNVVQVVGYAISDTELTFEPGTPFVRA